MYVHAGATAIATRCTFNGNGACGVFAENPNTKSKIECLHDASQFTMSMVWVSMIVLQSVVDLCGKNTDIHSNADWGIVAFNHGKVQIHLPSQHNTNVK